LRIYAEEGGAWATLERDWSAEDIQRLKDFLATPQGQNFLQRLRAMSLVRNRIAVTKSDPHENGKAAGYMECLTDIQLLSEFTSVTSTQEGESEEETEFGTSHRFFDPVGPERHQ
jgi:hypothetical protein